MELLLNVIPKSNVLVGERKGPETQRDTKETDGVRGRDEAQQWAKQCWHSQQQEGQRWKDFFIRILGGANPTSVLTVVFRLWANTFPWFYTTEFMTTCYRNLGMNTNLFFLFLFSFSLLFLFLLNWQNSDPGWLLSLYPKLWWIATANENGHWCYISYFLVAVTKHLIRNSLEEAHSEGM